MSQLSDFYMNWKSLFIVGGKAKPKELSMARDIIAFTIVTPVPSSRVAPEIQLVT